MTENLTVRLEGTGLPPGEITFSALSAVTGAFQELVTRIGRHLVRQPGAGRTAASTERATRLRLRGLEAGSTCLLVTVGDASAIPTDGELEDRAATLLWELFDTLNGDRPPAWYYIPKS